MTDSKHTSWFQGHTSFNGAKLRVYEGDGFRNHLIATAETEEAACLIAAAPELLEALREIETIMTESAGDCRKRMGTRQCNALAVARAAIAKADSL